MQKQLLLFVLTIMLSMVSFAGCEKKGAAKNEDRGEAEHHHEAEEEAEKPKSLTIYCGRKEEMMKPIFDKFKEESKIDLKVQYGKTAELSATLVEEGENSPADIFFSQDAGTLGWLANQGKFANIPSAELDKIVPEFRSPTGKWVATSGRARVLVYNTNSVMKDQLPKNIDELLEPKWTGQIGWAPENASFQDFVAALIAERGAEGTKKWLEGMMKQNTRAFPSNTPVVTAVGKGEILVGLVNHYYLYRLKKEYGPDFAAENYYFRNGKAESMINTAGVGILAKTEHMPEAKAFVKFMLSPETQTYFANQTHEFPVIPGVKTEDGLPPISSLNAPKIPNNLYENLATTNKLLHEVGALK